MHPVNYMSGFRIDDRVVLTRDHAGVPAGTLCIVCYTFLNDITALQWLGILAYDESVVPGIIRRRNQREGGPEGLFEAPASAIARSDTFVCECDTHERARYVVTDCDGKVAPAYYCDACADMARENWNGETAAIERDGSQGTSEAQMGHTQ